MRNTYDITYEQLNRQVKHWEIATQELSTLQYSASAEAWSNVENYVGVALRNSLNESLIQLRNQVIVVRSLLNAAKSKQDLSNVENILIKYRETYLKTETMIDYFGQAVNSRTNQYLGANLRAFDVLASKSMAVLLNQFGITPPPVLSYFDKGLGASILKAGLRLWDGTISPVATIKVAYHNRRRPTALIHETGHQVAHMLNWSAALSIDLNSSLSQNMKYASLWGSWASEIAADCYGFVHTGYASIAALSDVVAGDPKSVFKYNYGDPHPISYLRVLLGIEMCKQFYGQGPWDELRESWVERYSLDNADPDIREIITNSITMLVKIVDICLMKRMKVFNGKALTTILSPDRVSPRSLVELQNSAGLSLFQSSQWIWQECIRLIALTGYMFADRSYDKDTAVQLQDQLMTKLGNSITT